MGEADDDGIEDGDEDGDHDATDTEDDQQGTNEENMRYFCRNSQFLLVRKSLIEQGIDYSYRPDAMRKFLEQAKTIPDHMAGVETLPAFNQINALLEDQLE